MYFKDIILPASDEVRVLWLSFTLASDLTVCCSYSCSWLGMGGFVEAIGYIMAVPRLQAQLMTLCIAGVERL